jgi:peptide/nickel transport system substrate-binding protein
MRLIKIGAAAALITSAALVGGTSGVSAASEKTVTVQTAQIKTLNPFLSFFDSELYILGSIYPSLYQFDASNKPEPYLAESATTSPDHLTWTFKIRQGLKWTDGQPITAKDAAWTFNLIMTNSDAATANGSLVTNFASVSAPDDATLIIKTKTPQANMPYVSLTVYGIPIVPQHIWESKVKGLGKDLNNDYPIVGYGPFILTGYKTDQYATLEANKDFYQGKPKIDKLILQYFKNDDAAIAALRSGQIAAVYDVTATGWKSLSGVKGVMTYKQVPTRWTGVEVNPGAKTRSGKKLGTGNPILADPKVRLAMAYAIDRQTLVTKVLDGLGLPGAGYIPPAYTQFAWQPPAGAAISYNPARANPILDTAGYAKHGTYRVDPKTHKQLSFRLGTHSDDANDQAIAPYLVGWFKAIGIKLTPQPQSMSGLNDNLAKGDWDLLMDGWGTQPDPTYLLSIQTCGTLPKDDGSGGNTDAFFCDKKYDTLFTQQSQQFDVKQRAVTIAKMQQILYNANDDIMLYYNYILDAVRTDKVSDYVVGSPNSTGSYPLQSRVLSWKQAVPVTSSGSSNTGLWIGIGVAAAVVVLAAGAFTVWRRRTAAERE